MQHKLSFWLIIIATLLFVGGLTAWKIIPHAFADDASTAEDSHEDFFVTIYDDGKKLTVKTTASTVGDLLERLDYTYSSDDTIQPGIDSEISYDNFFINIFRARPVLLKDGIHSKYVMTSARDARSIYEDAGFTLYDDDKIVAASQSSILEIGLSETLTLERGQSYADAMAKKKAEEEAAKAAAEAEAARIAAAEAAAETAAQKTYSVRPEWETCAEYARAAGVSEADLGAALTLIYRESGCRVDATNAYSGAYGIPQALPGSKMGTFGDDWQTNPVTQIRWMINYVNGRYGGWEGALQQSDTKGWY